MSDMSTAAVAARGPNEATQTTDAIEIKQEPEKQGEQTPEDDGSSRMNRKMRGDESARRRKHEKQQEVIPVNDDDEPIVDVHDEDEVTKPPKKLMRSAAVKSRLGGISSQTLWRYCRDPELGFPPPFYINGVRHWEDDVIEDFIERQASA